MVRSEFIHFLPPLGAGKAGEMRQDVHVQLTDQSRVSFTALEYRAWPGASACTPGFFVITFAPSAILCEE